MGCQSGAVSRGSRARSHSPGIARIIDSGRRSAAASGIPRRTGIRQESCPSRGTGATLCRVRASPWILFVATLAAAGCHASVSAKAGGSAAQQEADFNEAQSVPIQPTNRSANNLAEAPESASTRQSALLGARHDVQLAADKRSAVCSCLAAYVGPPNDPAFKWESVVPVTDPDTQLAVALTSDGVPCDAKVKDSLGASYWGYRRHGDDVVITVESARFGRPVTNGAIIPKPTGTGHVYIVPAGKKTPYGRSLTAGQKLCQIR